MLATIPEPPAIVTRDPRQSFLALLPAIEVHAQSAFRAIRHYHDREDAVAEVIAHAWQTFATTGTQDTVSAKELAEPAVKAVLATMAPTHC